MIRRIAEYMILAGEADPVIEAIRDFVDAVHEHEPETIYEAYVRDDGVTFIHFMAFPDAAAEEAHRRAPYTERFVEVLYPRCEAPPVFTELASVERDDGDG